MTIQRPPANPHLLYNELVRKMSKSRPNRTGGHGLSAPKLAMVSAPFTPISLASIGAIQNPANTWTLTAPSTTISSGQSLTISAGQTLNINGGNFFINAGAALINNGSTNNNLSQVCMVNNGTITNTSSFHNYGGNTIHNNGGTINNNGAFATITNDPNAAITNNAGIINNSGTINNYGIMNSTHNAIITNVSGAYFNNNLNATFTNYGLHMVPSQFINIPGSYYTNNGTYTGVPPATAPLSAQTIMTVHQQFLSMPSPFVAAPPGFTPISLTSIGAVQNPAGTWTLTAPNTTILSGQSLTISAGQTLNINGGNFVINAGAALINNGSTNNNLSQVCMVNNGTITNTSSFHNYGGNTIHNNGGTINNNGGAATITNDPNAAITNNNGIINNSGTINNYGIMNSTHNAIITNVSGAYFINNLNATFTNYGLPMVPSQFINIPGSFYTNNGTYTGVPPATAPTN